MPQSFVSLTYHLVFSTKNREPLITDDLQQRLYDYIGGIIDGDGGVLLAAGGMEDHIHLLCGISKEMAVADALRNIKANSSKWGHETFAEHAAFGWQNGYGAFSVSKSGIEQVKHYIATQREHHAKMTFKEEFIALLQKHEIEFDERYLFE